MAKHSEAAGDSAQIEFQLTVNTPVPDGVTQIANQGLLSGSNIPQGSTDDPGTSANGDPTVILLGTAPLSVAPTANPPVAPSLLVFDPTISKVGYLQEGGVGLPGERLTWEITISNTGTGAGTNVVIVDTIASTLRIDSAAIDVGTAQVNGQTITFTIPVLNPGPTVKAYVETTVLQSPLDVENIAILSGIGPSQATETRTAQARVTGAALLPDTGYPPQAGDAPLSRLPMGLLVLASLGMVKSVAREVQGVIIPVPSKPVLTERHIRSEIEVFEVQWQSVFED